MAIPYKEERYAGPEGRAKWFDEVKPQLLDKNPVATLPYLIDGDKVITECDAICIHLSYKSKPELNGRNVEEEVGIATAKGIYKDLYPAYVQLVYKNYNVEYTLEQALAESVDRFEHHLRKLNGVLGEKEFIAGGLTWIDFGLADFLQTLTLLHESFLKGFPKLLDYYKRVWALPELKEYFSSGKFKERPCNNYTAAWK